MKLKNLNTNFLGLDYSFYDEIDSTQDEIWRRIQNGTIKNGTLVRARIQNSGKGTHGRVWYTTEENIAFSFYMNLNCNLNRIDDLTYDIARILVEVFKEEYDIKLNIKLPNDLYFNGKKIGGILTQTKCVGEIVRDLVIGIGINTNQKEFVSELNGIASSITNEFNIMIDNDLIISKFCNKFEKNIFERIDK